MDAASILGVPVNPGKAEEKYGDFTCDVRPSDESVRGQFLLVVDTDNGVSNFAKQKELAASPKAVVGLGDEAFRDGARLFVVDGDAMVYVNVLRDRDTGGPIETDALKNGACHSSHKPARLVGSFRAARQPKLA